MRKIRASFILLLTKPCLSYIGILSLDFLLLQFSAIRINSFRFISPRLMFGPLYQKTLIRWHNLLKTKESLAWELKNMTFVLSKKWGISVISVRNIKGQLTLFKLEFPSYGIRLSIWIIRGICISPFSDILNVLTLIVLGIN